ncbi:hypothetical protein HNY73_017502 [Argiope bruennichi]|uniref:Uncharacterized protein n=1 Tax=Argiope bruennichi TaxID=94029 RepID=A0A8T0EB42_ARGBR|nr:hypothetical protein HNY73_017502 [Argiope bruennichi]
MFVVGLSLQSHQSRGILFHSMEYVEHLNKFYIAKAQFFSQHNSTPVLSLSVCHIQEVQPDAALSDAHRRASASLHYL